MKTCCKCSVVLPDGRSHIWCKPCYAAWKRDWRKNNPELVAAQLARARERNPDVFKQYDKRSYYKNREKRIAKARKWNVENKEAFAAREAARRAAQIKATPAWADVKSVKALYVKAAELTKTTGILHHVDHIIPLVSGVVAGLHVPDNLRVIPAYDNQSKSNRTWPGMP